MIYFKIKIEELKLQIKIKIDHVTSTSKIPLPKTTDFKNCRF